MENLLDIKQLNLYIGNGDKRLQILHDINMQIKTGEILGLIGPSGSGKSMMAKAILGLNSITGLSMDGQLLYNMNGEAMDLMTSELMVIRNTEIGIVFQHSTKVLNPAQSIGAQIKEKILYNRTAENNEHAQQEQFVMGLLSEVGLTPAARFYEAYPHELSGGELQRSLIALALTNNPKLIIADEPLSALDTKTTTAILKLLSSLRKKRGTAIILISHDLRMVMDYCDSLVIIDEGHIISQGQPAYFHKSGQPALVKEMMDALQPEKVAEPIQSAAKEPIFSIRNVTKIYGDDSNRFTMPWGKAPINKVVLDDFSLEVYHHEILGLYGPSGYGKSTLARVMGRLEAVDKGRIYFKGVDITEMKSDSVKAFRRSCQFIFQDPLSAMSPHRLVRAHLTDVHYVSEDSRKADLDQIMEEVGLPVSYLDRYPRQLSGGERQRVLIARTLMTGAEFLICDEIFSSLDIIVAIKIAALLKNLVSRRGLTMLFISHDRHMLERLCSRVIDMAETSKI